VYRLEGLEARRRGRGVCLRLAEIHQWKKQVRRKEYRVRERRSIRCEPGRKRLIVLHTSSPEGARNFGEGEDTKKFDQGLKEFQEGRLGRSRVNGEEDGTGDSANYFLQTLDELPSLNEKSQGESRKEVNTSELLVDLGENSTKSDDLSPIHSVSALVAGVEVEGVRVVTWKKGDEERDRNTSNTEPEAYWGRSGRNTVGAHGLHEQ